ncbi:MAG: flippase [Shewanella sp.]|jgi:O-antigen/teichoic acid export membrane protein|uniref:flippase n=1 Tax=Shewanella sp. TaxID=50422 RepID=UPI0035616B83
MFDKLILKNIGSLFGIQIAGYVIPLITLPYLVRVLGVEGYGYLGFSLAITQYFILIVNYGFDLSATSNIAKVSKDKGRISEIFWNVLLIRLFASFIGLILLIIAIYSFSNLYEIFPILLSCYIMVLGTAMFPQWLFQGKERLGLVSTVRVALQFCTIPLIFIFVTGKENIWQAALIGSMPTLGIAIISALIIFRRGWIVWIRPTSRAIKNELIAGWHIFISTAAINLYTTSVTVVLGVIAGPVSVGYFTAADRLMKAILGLYGPLSNAFYPRINSAVMESTSKALILIKKLATCIFSIAIISSFCLYFLSDYITLMLFGRGFSVTADLLKILCILPIVIGLSNILGVQVLIPFGYKKEFSKILMFSGVISILILIPLSFLYEEYGAAVSVLITEVIVTTLMWLTVNKKRIFKKN